MASEFTSVITNRFARFGPLSAFCSILLGILLGSWSGRFSADHVSTEAIEIEVAGDSQLDTLTGIFEPTGAVWYAGSYELPSCLAMGDVLFSAPAICRHISCHPKRSRAPPS
jgi:hypothetical protein